MSLEGSIQCKEISFHYWADMEQVKTNLLFNTGTFLIIVSELSIEPVLYRPNEEISSFYNKLTHLLDESGSCGSCRGGRVHPPWDAAEAVGERKDRESWILAWNNENIFASFFLLCRVQTHELREMSWLLYHCAMKSCKVFAVFSSGAASDWVQTLELRLVSWFFYHCATMN